MLSIAIAMSTLVFYGQQIATNSIKSTQAYYAAESGIEDALIRLKDNSQMSSKTYTLMVNNATTTVTIPNIVGGSRAISSEGDVTSRIRKLQAVYSIDSQGVSFHYGAQVGAGGLTMNNGSRVVGNVFSNGNISGGSGVVDNDVIVAGMGNSINDITVGGNVRAHSCFGAEIIGELKTVVGSGDCTFGTQGSLSEADDPIPLPITEAQIEDWKDNATSGEVINGDFVVGNFDTESLGPTKITGKLVINNGGTLNITGTIYVVGSVLFDNNSIIKLDSSYGSLGGVVLSDSNIDVKNNASLNGSGQAGSYLLVLSTSASDLAILVDNNAAGAIFYTNNGGVVLSNNIVAKEITGYKVKLDNNAAVEYGTGLANVLFTNGPSGSWNVVSWGEK